jgi:hypothetical protein
VNADVLALRSSCAHTVVTLVRLDGAYMEDRMIARVKAGAQLVEHHRDAADAGKHRTMIDGLRVKCARLHFDVAADPSAVAASAQPSPGTLLDRCAGTP